MNSINHLTPNDILQKFYDDHNIGDNGGNHLPYVTIEITNSIKLYIPNWDDRRKAVLRHDIHHVLTGYESKMVGEFQIAAWEIASGCLKFWAAYLLNAGGLVAGILFYTTITFQAFMKGCRSKNLYITGLSEEMMTFTKISELKSIILFSEDSSNPTLLEISKLIFHFIFSGIVVMLSGILIPILIIFNIYTFFKLKCK